MPSAKNIFGTGCLTLLAFPMLIGGIAVLRMGIDAYTTWRAMQTWQEVPAHIEEVKLNEFDSDGDGGPIYSVDACYTYHWEGREYMGNRVSIHKSKDNHASFYPRIYKELDEHRMREQAFRCYVDPMDPTQSILYRDLRRGIVAAEFFGGVLFLGAACFLLSGLVFRLVRTDNTEALKRQYPNAPWYWKQEWCAGVIHSKSKAKMLKTLLFAVFWNLASAPLCFIVVDEVQDGNTKILLALIFPAIGVVFIIAFIYLFLRWLKFGKTTFHMASVPGVLGGRLRGTIRIPTVLLLKKEIVLVLECVRTYRTHDSKESGKENVVLWQMDTVLLPSALLHKGRATFLPVDFYVPYDKPVSNDSNPDNTFTWTLRVEAPMPGVNFTASFDVPIFKTAQSDIDINSTALNRYYKTAKMNTDGRVVPSRIPANTLPTAGMLRRAGLRVEPLPRGGVAIISPMLRQPMLALSMLLFIVLWGGAIKLGQHLGVPIYFSVIFGICLVPMLWFFLELVVGMRRLEVNREGIRVRNGLFGLGVSKHISFDMLDHLEIEDGMSVTSAGSTKQYHAVVLRKRDGKGIKSITQLQHSEARALMQAVCAAIRDYSK